MTTNCEICHFTREYCQCIPEAVVRGYGRYNMHIGGLPLWLIRLFPWAERENIVIICPGEEGW